MMNLGELFVTFSLIAFGQTSGSSLSLNQPKLCPYASWNPMAITFANDSTVGANPYSIFIDLNNTVYVSANGAHSIQEWAEGSQVPTRSLPCNPCNNYGLLVTNDGDIYLDNGRWGRVERWRMNASNRTVAIYVTDPCYGLFIDRNGSLYCSVPNANMVLKNYADSGPNVTFVIAGNGTPGYAGDLLSAPAGIFVDDSFRLYVADAVNNRIQIFLPGERNGTTLFGNETVGSIRLYQPMAVVPDGDWYLFIVDYGNHRIVGSGPTGLRCIAGCSGVGTGANQLQYPTTMAFDSHGNLFVADFFNSRIQKFLLINNTCAVSYNQPKFSTCAYWNPNAITFADNTTIGKNPFGLFIDAGNTIYATNRRSLLIRIWSHGNTPPSRTLSYNLINPRGIFATINGDVYVDSGTQGRIDKWTPTAIDSMVVMHFNFSCFALFLDRNNTIYCAMGLQHQIGKQASHNDLYTVAIAAGTGANGTAADMLSNPCGIFVDTDFTLFVADTDNHRIQRFLYGQSSGITLAGTGAPGTITLNRPHAIVLDGDGYLFIVELGSHRITASGPLGFSCVAACTGTSGPASDQLLSPVNIALDSQGNIFVIDRDNARIQQFVLATNTCTETSTVQSLLTSTTIDSVITTDPLTTSITVTTSTTQITSTSATTSITEVVSTTQSVSTQETTSTMKTLFISLTTVAAEIPSITQITSSPSSTLTAESSSISPTTPTVMETTWLDRAVSTKTIPTTAHANADTSNGDTVKLTTFSSTLSTDTKSSLRTSSSLTTAVDRAIFISPLCPNPLTIGASCNISATPCDILNPCQNNGTCRNTNATSSDFFCLCPVGFGGPECQNNEGPCQANTCWNAGKCQGNSNATFNCTCSPGWEGTNCERTVDFCRNAQCLNQGVCRPLLGDYQCECLQGSYFGRHCEDAVDRVRRFQIIAKSFAFIAITAMSTVVLFIVIMDVLKYFFGIEPTYDRPVKPVRRPQRRLMVVQRFVYVHDSTTHPSE